MTAKAVPINEFDIDVQVELPPVLYLQGTSDLAHPRPDLDRFVTQYRKAGGRVALELYEGEEQGFVKSKWGSPNSRKAIEKIIEFVHREIR